MRRPRKNTSLEEQVTAVVERSIKTRQEVADLEARQKEVLLKIDGENQDLAENIAIVMNAISRHASKLIPPDTKEKGLELGTVSIKHQKDWLTFYLSCQGTWTMEGPSSTCLSAHKTTTVTVEWLTRNYRTLLRDVAKGVESIIDNLCSTVRKEREERTLEQIEATRQAIQEANQALIARVAQAAAETKAQEEKSDDQAQ